MRRTVLITAAAVAAVLGMVACSPEDEDATGETSTSPSSSGTPTAADCSTDALDTLADGKLTIATDQPAYPPWVVDDDPTNKQGFESAVAYAVAGELGYADADVVWTRVGFNAAIQPGAKKFDFDINQFTITKKRAKAVDFSSPYYTVSQAVVATSESPAAGATSVAELKGLKVGAQVSTTSLDVLNEVIAPTTAAAVFNTNDDAKLALQNGQVDAIVVDLPTAFYITTAELDNGVIVGQLPSGDDADEFGLLLDKKSPLTTCVSRAVDNLKADGTLDDLKQQWLADVADAPVLK